MSVAVIKRIILSLKTLRPVERISVFKLLVKKIRMVKIKLAFGRLGEILFKTAVIVIARRHHIRHALDYPLKSAEHSVPLQLILPVVAVIAGGEDKPDVGVFFERKSEHICNR